MNINKSQLLAAAVIFQAALKAASRAQPDSSYSLLDELASDVHPDTINKVCDGVDEMVSALGTDTQPASGFRVEPSSEVFATITRNGFDVVEINRVPDTQHASDPDYKSFTKEDFGALLDKIAKALH